MQAAKVVSSPARGRLKEYIEFGGRKFQLSDNTEQLEITHAVCGMHAIRGPMIVRWMKQHPNPEQRRQEILADIFKLYGSAVSSIKFVSIYDDQAAKATRNSHSQERG